MATPVDDYSEQSFFFPEFIKAMAPLDKRSALEYFTFSPWYRTEPPSNNQILRMQNTGMDVVAMDEAEELRKFTGIEFAVVHEQAPSLFIIHKRERLSPEEVRPIEAYYIVNNRIQQSPDLYSLISNRLNASIHNLLSSMSSLRERRPAYTPTKGHVWPVSFDPTSAFVASGKKHANSGDDASTPMNAETPAGGAGESSNSLQAGGSVSGNVPSQTSASSSTDNPQITMPLLHAIRTTAAHIQQISPLPSAIPAPAPAASLPARPGVSPVPTKKRVVRHAMDLAMSSAGDGRIGETMEEATLSLPDVSAPLAGAPSAFHQSVVFDSALVASRRVSTPGTQPSTPNSSQMDAGTPGGERKKKKKRGLKDTPIAARSPALPPL